MADVTYDDIDAHLAPQEAGPIHFIGIGGAGMSVLARMFSTLGVQVSGSDAKASAVTRALQAQGIEVGVPQAAHNINNPSTVVVSSAIRADNPELVRARETGARIIHRSQALALLMRGQRAVAVAGAHGKTTTSAMIAVAANAAGTSPSFAIGGSVRTATGAIAGGAVGDSDVLVAEADESDGSFLNYEPYIAVVTNIEPDHLDHYGSKEAFEQAFVQFAQRITPTGALVACADDPGARALADEVARQGRIAITYGQDGDADLSITNLTQIPGTQQATFDVTWSDGIVTGLVGGTVHLKLQVPGIHNALNATGAFAALLFLGITPEEAARGLHEFVGTGRRFEERGVVDGVTVVDDYAHHPTEVAALLSAARVSAGAGRVLVLFQPHLYSRTRIFAAEFANALDHADETVLTAIYAAREDHDPATSSQMIAELMRSSVQYVPEREAAAREIARRARTGDLILTVGAGDVTELGDVVLDELQKLRS